MPHHVKRNPVVEPNAEISGAGPAEASVSAHAYLAVEPAARFTTAIDFDERAYVSTYADVTASLATQEYTNAQEHFERFGRKEGRLTDERYIRALGLIRMGPAPVAGRKVQLSVDALVCCRSGMVLVVGWVDDRDSPLSSLSIFAGRDRAWNTTAFGRIKRADVEASLQAATGHLFGFWSVAKLGSDLSAGPHWVIRCRLADGSFGQIEVKARFLSEPDLRTTILGYVNTAEYYGNRLIESFLSLDVGIGAALVELNREVTASVVAGAWVSYYGPTRERYRGSVIVCLFGKYEFMFLQSALFSLAEGARDYELVYVSNSPELTEILEREARICARIYGISIVLVCLPNNAGFGAANNVAARYARSDRLLFTNPDVFPRDNDWAVRHTRIIEIAPVEQTLMFGAPLYYDDGSLMHHGMYFEVDVGISMRPDGIYTRPMIRTEHYGKGAPVWSQQFACPRPVPAITGAFISADRDWFETLGGFTEDFLFGHYEDADLCLKSLVRGKPVWMQDFPLWHMEGKSSIRLPAHEGAILVNRWLFTKKWGDLIISELRGADPTCPALHVPPAAVAPATPAAEPPEPSPAPVRQHRGKSETVNAPRRSRS
jgi:GT2 family glycosyltransferase